MVDLQVGLSILSASFNLAKLFTNYVFGKKITARSRIGLQAVQFCFYLLVFSTAVKYLAEDTEFCSRKHTIFDEIRLFELTNCGSIVNDTNIALEISTAQARISSW